jgi:hypothetical protein
LCRFMLGKHGIGQSLLFPGFSHWKRYVSLEQMAALCSSIAAWCTDVPLINSFFRKSGIPLEPQCVLIPVKQ